MIMSKTWRYKQENPQKGPREEETYSMPYHVSIRELQVKGLTYQSSKMERVKNANAGSRILICIRCSLALDCCLR